MPPRKVKAEKSKIRASWEPPYSQFEDIIVAEKEVYRRHGSNEIRWRTEIMDVMIEGDFVR